MPSDSPEQILADLQKRGVLDSNGILVACRLEFRQRVFLGVDEKTMALVAVRPNGSLSIQSVTRESIHKISPNSIQTTTPSFIALVDESLWHFDEIPTQAADDLKNALEKLLGVKLQEEVLKKSQVAKKDSEGKTKPPVHGDTQHQDYSPTETAPPGQADPTLSSAELSNEEVKSLEIVKEQGQSDLRNVSDTIETGNETDIASPAQDYSRQVPKSSDESLHETEEDETEEDDDPDEPWYATVQGPAIDMYFHDKKSKEDIETEQTTELQSNSNIAPKSSPSHPAPSSESSQKRKDGKPREVGSLKRLIVRWRKELFQNPGSIKPYRELCRIFMQSGDKERAYWHSAVLSHFGVAEKVERDFYEQHRPKYPKYIGPSADHSVWMEAIRLEEIDNWPKTLFSILARPLTLQMGKTLRSYGLKRKDRCDVKNAKLLLANIFSRLREAMGFPGVDLFLNPEADFEILLANVVEKKRWSPLFVAGKRILTGRTEEEITFLLARDMACLHPENIVCLLLPERAQQTFLMTAVMKLVKPNLVGSSSVPERDKMAKMLSSELEPNEKSALEKLVDEMVMNKIEVNLSEWAGLTRMAADRAGLLFCQDLATAVRLSSVSPMVPSSPEETEARIRNLVLYSISPQHFQAREKLRIKIE